MKIRVALSLIILAGLAACFMASCGNRTVSVIEGEIVYQPKYAAGFTVTQAGEGRILNIYDPWQGAEGVSMQVFLSKDGATPPDGFEGVTLNVPLNKVICMSSSHVGFITELGLEGAIRGVSGAKYISNPEVREAYREGKVFEVGYDAGLNYELISLLQPDVVFAFGIAGENSALSGKLAELGINLVYIGDYVEGSPLGKAEWLVAFGYMFGIEERAIDRFSVITENYFGIKQVVQGISPKEKPVVMINAPYRDTWFVPGDRSYMVKLIEDAGGTYACGGEDSGQSRPISLEEAYIKMLSADIWLNPGQALTIAEVKAENPRFAATPPVVNRRIYNNNKRQTPEGGSDFWESGSVRPDIVLEDMMYIFYPWFGTLEDASSNPHGLYYFRRLE